MTQSTYIPPGRRSQLVLRSMAEMDQSVMSAC
jgi:hypothetical protein